MKGTLYTELEKVEINNALIRSVAKEKYTRENVGGWKWEHLCSHEQTEWLKDASDGLNTFNEMTEVLRKVL